MNSCEAYKVLLNVRWKSGAQKLHHLSLFPQVKPILGLALNPYITFGVTDPGVAGTGINDFKAGGVKLLLDRLANRHLTGQAAIDTVSQVQRDLTKESAALLGIILDKNPRIGVAAKSVNKIWPGLIPVHEVMLCKKFEANKVVFPCYMEPKLDGIRGTVSNGQFFTRNGLKIQGLEVLEEELKSLPQHEWDGELTIPGLSFQKASGLLRSDESTPTAVFTIFAARDTSLNELLKQGLRRETPNIVFISAILCYRLPDVYHEYERFRELGFEGAIVKNPHYKYAGKRSWDWMKLKPSEDGEFKIIGMYEGEGKYVSQLGGITVDFNGKPNDVGTGFSDEQRYEFWNEPSKCPVGLMAHIEYMEKTDDGNMRHSRFKDLRWDK